VGTDLLKMELRFIAERIRQRVRRSSNFVSTAWSPRFVDVPPGERFLVLAPHPDDDAIGCGGTILKLLAAGKSVRVAYLSLQSSVEYSRAERIAEVERAMAILGVKDFLFLEESFPSKERLVDHLEKEISSQDCDSVFLPSPIENHDQHTAVFWAFQELNRRKAIPGMNAILYEVWTPVVANMLVDISEFIHKKTEAIGAHGTQTAQVDFARAVEGLDSYRASMSGHKGYAEAFFFQTSSDLSRTFG
jgi:LmbE family N-acetylglucosaminyl deacetylase